MRANGDRATRSAPAQRTVEVVPPARSSEAVNVVLAMAAIATVAIYVILFRGGGARAGAELPPELLPFQVSFQDLPGAEQRLVRELVLAFDESRRMRVAQGKWPSAQELSGQGVPPFAPDAIDQAGYRWSSREKDLIVNYEGVPASAASPDLLLLIQEPPPTGGEAVLPGVVDEEHQLLPDGRLLHVTYWKRKHKDEDVRLIAQPAAEGWTQIRFQQPQETAR